MKNLRIASIQRIAGIAALAAVVGFSMIACEPLPEEREYYETHDLRFTLINDGAAYSVSAARKDISGEVDIPADYRGLPVTAVGDGAFSNMTGLTSVIIPSSAAYIGSTAFYGCAGIAAITIPARVTVIGYRALIACSSLTSVVFAAGSAIAGEDLDGSALPGNLREVYLAGGAGTYTRVSTISNAWTKQ